ncbi:MAG: prepilin peptidase [Candidatus Rokuibacteriota bacterium]
MLVPLLVALGLIAVLDLRARTIPDVITVPGIVYALAVSAVGGSPPLDQAALGALVGGGVLLLVAVVSRGGVGGGDIKLMAMLGAATGWQAALAILALSQLAAALVVVGLVLTRRARSPFPVGAVMAFFGSAVLMAR